MVGGGGGGGGGEAEGGRGLVLIPSNVFTSQSSTIFFSFIKL